MKVATLANAKAHLSDLINDVESGADVVITRRGRPVARLVAEPTAPEAVGWEALHAWVDAAPDVTAMTVAELRERGSL